MNFSNISRRIFAHRGFWKSDPNHFLHTPNSAEALRLASDEGFSLETDIRDHEGRLVISHDIPNHDCLDFSWIMDNFKNQSCLALNIKSDGLIDLFKKQPLHQKFNKRFFFFDLSFPESVKYREAGYLVADRVSDLEIPQIINEDYIWIDAFHYDWYLDSECFLSLLNSSKNLVLVSPELHHRDPFKSWDKIVNMFINYENLSICTDYPDYFRSMLKKI